MIKTLLLLLLFLPLISYSQYAESIRTGRPGQGIGAYTLGKSVVQIQSGFNYNDINTAQFDFETQGWNTVIRLGITERFEVSGLINYQKQVSTGKDHLNPSVFENSGINNLQLGARVNLTKNEGFIPAIALQSRVLLKLPSSDFTREKLGLKNILVTVNKLSEKFSLMTNWVLLVPGGKVDVRTEYVANLSYSITEKIGVFGELYGNLGQKETRSFDGGFSYLVNNDLQLDLSGGIQDSDSDSDYFIDFGFSWRTDWRK